MEKIKNLSDLAQELDDRGVIAFDDQTTIGDIARALYEIGLDRRVLAFQDENLGLETDLEEELKNVKLNEDIDDKYCDDVDHMIDVAKSSFKILDKDLTEDEKEDIREDMISRGEDPDDFDEI